MAPAPPLPVTEDTPPDMLAGSMDLRVVLPGGRAVKMSAERCTPMMDLLVQVTTANKMAPGGFVLQPVGERGVLPYKPSTPIGALDTWTIQIVPKTRTISSTSLKKAPLKPNNQQPFEQTFRLQVHLPRNQLFVTRVSPKSLLSDVLNLACTEKNLDPNKYELRHPANLEERLRPEWTLADYKLQEVTLVAKGNRPLGSGLSSSDIMALQKEEEKRRQQVRANGGTGSAVLGLMLGKNSQSSGCDGSISSDSLGGRSISPARSDETPSPPGSSLPPPRPTRKRRPAPKPPTQAAPHQQPAPAVISHSRNSSDSSGYHEASILSESPESNGLSSPSGTLPRRSKLTSNSAQPPNVATSHNLSRSLSNLTHMSNGENKTGPMASSIQKNGHSVSTTSLASSGHGKKKKAAPPPPPPATARSSLPGHLLPEQRTASLSTLSSQSSGDSFDRELYSRSATLERPPSSQSSTTSNIVRPESLPEEITAINEDESISPNNESVQNLSSKLSQQELKALNSLRESEIPVSLAQPQERKSPDIQLHHRNYPELDSTSESSGHSTPSHVERPVPFEPQPQIRITKPVVHSSEDSATFIRETTAPVSEPAVTKPAKSTSNVAAPRPTLPDVVSAEKVTPPTPKPRGLTVQSSRNTPTPRPRARKSPSVPQRIKYSETQTLLSDSVERDSAFDSEGTRSDSPRSFEVVKTRGKFGGTFGVGKTIVMLASSARNSVSSESGTKSIHSLDSDAEMITRFGTDNDYEDDDALNISENDLEMFETKSGNIDSPSAEQTVHDTGSLFDSISVASSVFDSEHETSDGTWDRSSVSSRDFTKLHLSTKNSLQPPSTRMSLKQRPCSPRSMEDAPSSLETGDQLDCWPNSEDVHGSGKNWSAELQKERDEIQQEFESVTKELQAVILAEEAKQVSSAANLPSPKTESPSVSLVDWEYHLPAPPSAFRDSLSPTLTTETDNVSEVPTFEESTPEVLPPAEFTDSDKFSQQAETSLTSLMIEKECPLIKNLVKGVTKVNPLFNDEKYEAEILEEFKHSKENKPSLVNSYEMKNEEDWNPQLIGVPLDSVNEPKSQNKSTSSYENHQTNQLKNFTISAYQRPNDTDILFKSDSEKTKQESEFKKPLETSVFKRKDSNSSTNIPRNNSFSTKNSHQSERAPVKRSTSHVTFNNSGRTLRAKSIGNLAMETSWEGCGSQATESRMHDGHEGLRKTTSEANINQDYGRSSRLAELQDQFLQWQEQLLRETQPDIPLQSLQVLRRILSPSHDASRDKTKEKRLSDEPSYNLKNSDSSKPNSNENTDASELSSSSANEVQLRRQSSNASNAAKRYSYQGPPAVNFSTWSERPKSQVSLKVDNDYRIGKGQNSSGPTIPNKLENVLEARERKISEDQVDSKANPAALTRSESMTHVNGHAKVEPTALTMRIISHTTPSGFKKISPATTGFTSKSQDLTQSKEKDASASHHTITRIHSYNSAQIADPSRVPIVRAVELKKSFLQGQQIMPQPEKKPNTTNIKLSWNEGNNNLKSVPVNGIHNNDKNNKDDDDAEETFQGVNNLAKRFSLAASNSEGIKFNATNKRPLSAYLPSDPKPKIDSDMKNESNLKEANYFNNSNAQNNVKKYTSVVGVNGVSSSGSFKEPTQDGNQFVPKVAITTQKSGTNVASKQTGAFNARHPMPVVKGFRFATSDYSDSSLVAADSYKVPQNSQQSVTVKVQQNNSFHNPNQRNSIVIESAPVVNLRIQPASASKPSQGPTNGSRLIPEPPSAPALPKKTQISRPKSFPVPEVNPRDELMDAIRSFGGRGKLRQVRAPPPNNVLLIM
ncbi:Uncharacterized protein GBIM_01444 [Gryllus bimaculatus]|nr:Uncharacterized protein GBIM_01444 [Gryllus bimaculatus]